MCGTVKRDSILSARAGPVHGSDLGVEMPDRFIFSTEAYPAHERFSAFCEEIVRRYTNLDFDTQERCRFRASMELRRAGFIDIGHNSKTAMNSVRTANHVRDGDDSVLITLVERGSGYQTQREENLKLAPGDGVIGDCGYPGELNFIAESQFWNVKVPRSKIAALLPPNTSFGGTRLDRDPVARRLLVSYLSGAFEIELEDGGRATQLYEDHIVALVALAVGAESNAREMAERQGVREVRRAAILREIDGFMSDPNLSAATIAARFGITPRYLRMLLEVTGRSFTEHLLERRLERAAALLRDPAHRRRRIAEIASACGFGDLSYFNRVFRRRYGATPSETREAAACAQLE
jgi:AraC-like DNA-binding protein